MTKKLDVRRNETPAVVVGDVVEVIMPIRKAAYGEDPAKIPTFTIRGVVHSIRQQRRSGEIVTSIRVTNSWGQLTQPITFRCRP